MGDPVSAPTRRQCASSLAVALLICGFRFIPRQDPPLPVMTPTRRSRTQVTCLVTTVLWLPKKKNSQYTWKILKNGAKKKFSGSTICWIPGSKKTGVRGYEAGLFMGRGSCHLDNDGNEIMVKSHYTNAKGWYGGQHALLNSGSLQAKSGKIAIWVRAK